MNKFSQITVAIAHKLQNLEDKNFMVKIFEAILNHPSATTCPTKKYRTAHTNVN